jgi:hypothetical protein
VQRPRLVAPEVEERQLRTAEVAASSAHPRGAEEAVGQPDLAARAQMGVFQRRMAAAVRRPRFGAAVVKEERQLRALGEERQLRTAEVVRRRRLRAAVVAVEVSRGVVLTHQGP